MVYVAGIIGFVCGFAMGQVILAYMLRNRSNHDLKNDRTLRIYGVLNWMVAILVAVAAVQLARSWGG